MGYQLIFCFSKEILLFLPSKIPHGDYTFVRNPTFGREYVQEDAHLVLHPIPWR